MEKSLKHSFNFVSVIVQLARCREKLKLSARL